MKEPITCGAGVAEYAPLPEKLADVFEAMADTLANHRRALDLDDPASREEDTDFAKLVDEQRELVTRLRSVEARMSGYKNLPMGRHDMSMLGGPIAVAAFEKYVEAEQHLLALLQLRLARDRRMLDSMR